MKTQKLQVCADFRAVKSQAISTEGHNPGLHSSFQLNWPLFCLAAGEASSGGFRGLPWRTTLQNRRQGYMAHLLQTWELNPTGLDL